MLSFISFNSVYVHYMHNLFIDAPATVAVEYFSFSVYAQVKYLYMYTMPLSAGIGWPTMSTSNVQPRVCSCTRWPPASARRSICTASGPSQATHTADQSSTTTTILWSTSTPPAPVLTPCLWSSELWAHCTDRGRSSSTPDPVILGDNHRMNHTYRWQSLRWQMLLRILSKLFCHCSAFVELFFCNWNDLFSTSGKLKLGLSSYNEISTATFKLLSLVW